MSFRSPTGLPTHLSELCIAAAWESPPVDRRVPPLPAVDSSGSEYHTIPGSGKR